MKKYLSYFIFLLSPLVLFGDTVNTVSTVNGGRSFIDGGAFFPNQKLVYKDCKFECKAGIHYNLNTCECKGCNNENKNRRKCSKLNYKEAFFYFSLVDRNLEINKDKNKSSAQVSILLQKVYTPSEKKMRVKGKIVHIKDYKEDIVTDCNGKQLKLRVTATATYDPDNERNNTIKYRIKELK